MRLPYVPNPPTGLAAEEAAVVERITARRGAKGLIPLDLTLLHSPPIADGCNALFAAVRTKTSLTEDVLEIAICRTTLVLGAWHEWNGHVAKLLASPGFPAEQGGLAVVRAVHLTAPGPLGAKQWAALRYADHMSRAAAVPDDVFGALAAAGFAPREIVELTALVGAYNMIGRVFVALDIAEANEKKPMWLDDE